MSFRSFFWRLFIWVVLVVVIYYVEVYFIPFGVIITTVLILFAVLYGMFKKGISYVVVNIILLILAIGGLVSGLHLTGVPVIGTESIVRYVIIAFFLLFPVFAGKKSSD